MRGWKAEQAAAIAVIVAVWGFAILVKPLLGSVLMGVWLATGYLIFRELGGGIMVDGEPDVQYRCAKCLKIVDIHEDE